MHISHLTKQNILDALPLVWEVFLAYEAVDYPEEGKKAFWDAIRSEDYLNMLDAYGAYIGDKLVGIIATRSEGSHIALFFVDGRHHRQGIGRALFDACLAGNRNAAITVHSSLYAAGVYRRLGFIPCGEVCEDGGIRYIPMKFTR